MKAAASSQNIASSKSLGAVSLILTSQHYILNQIQNVNEVLRIDNIEVLTSIVKLCFEITCS